MTCAACGGVLLEGSRFCERCGTPVPRVGQTCEWCGAASDSSARFCASCGKRLAATLPTPRGVSAAPAGSGRAATEPSPASPAPHSSAPGAVETGSDQAAAPLTRPVVLPSNVETSGPRTTRRCAHCGEPLGAVEAFCPSCGVHNRPHRARWPYAVAGVLAALLVLGAGGWVLFGPYLLPSGFKAASYMPRDTWMVAAVTLRPGLTQILGARSVAEAFTRQPSYEATVRSLQSGSTPSPVDWEKEVLPLLDGEMAVGLYGSPSSPEAVAFLHTSDPERLLRVLAAAERKPEPRERYRDGLYYETGANRTIVIASPKGWIVTGTSRGAAERGYDRLDAGGGDSLADDQRYTSLMERLPGDRVGYAYFDSRFIMADAQVRRSWDAVPPQFRDYLDPINARAAMSIATANDGVELRWESIPDRPLRKGKDVLRGSTLAALEQVPNDTLVAVAGDSLPALMSGLDEAATTAMRASMGAFAPRIEFQFARWMAGEFAMGIGSGTVRLDPRGYQIGQPDVLMTARIKDSASASADIAALDTLLYPKPATVSGISMKQVGSGESSLLYGIADEWLVLAAGQTDKIISTRGSQRPGLSANGNFGLIRRTIADDGIALFVDLENGRRTLENLLTPQQRQEYDQKVRVFLQPLRALGGSLRTEESGEVHGTLFVAVRP